MSGATFDVARSVVIDAPPEAVYPHLVDFHRWQVWSPWEGIDPSQSRTYSGPDRGVGAHYAWKGNRRVGEGSMTIVDVDEPAIVRVEIRFIKPFRATNDARFTIQPMGARSQVTWRLTGPLSLMLRLMSVVRPMDKMVGPDFERGLARLKAAVEAAA